MRPMVFRPVRSQRSHRSSIVPSSLRAMFDRMPQLAEGLPSQGGVERVAQRDQERPLAQACWHRRWRIGLSVGGSPPSLSTGTITARSLRGSAAMISASNSCRSGRADDQLLAPRATT